MYAFSINSLQAGDRLEITGGLAGAGGQKGVSLKGENGAIIANSSGQGQSGQSMYLTWSRNGVILGRYWANGGNGGAGAATTANGYNGANSGSCSYSGTAPTSPSCTNSATSGTLGYGSNSIKTGVGGVAGNDTILDGQSSALTVLANGNYAGAGGGGGWAKDGAYGEGAVGSTGWVQITSGIIKSYRSGGGGGGGASVMSEWIDVKGKGYTQFRVTVGNKGTYNATTSVSTDGTSTKVEGKTASGTYDLLLELQGGSKGLVGDRTANGVGGQGGFASGKYLPIAKFGSAGELGGLIVNQGGDGGKSGGVADVGCGGLRTGVGCLLIRSNNAGTVKFYDGQSGIPFNSTSKSQGGSGGGGGGIDISQNPNELGNGGDGASGWMIIEYGTAP